MNACQHEKYTAVGRGGATRECDRCFHRWYVHDGELHFAPGVVGGFTADALLTPRDERTPGMRQVLGLE